MPQIDYSIGFTTAEVQEILAIQKAELKKTLAAYADNGSSVSKRRIDVPRPQADQTGREASRTNSRHHCRLPAGLAETRPGRVSTADPCFGLLRGRAVGTVRWSNPLDLAECYNYGSHMLVETKTRKVGNSVGLILPKEVLNRMNLQEGDRVFLTEAADGGFRITPHDPEFEKQMAAAQSVMKRYRNTLRELAK